ncbi:carboxylesterase family protein [Streptomyces sp. NPDC046182]|uniref:carboxylesterase family protein n=1 Tax=Streptomyces sp. NPDC046182 TaxID=3154601 RepID=UPI0033FC8365
MRENARRSGSFGLWDQVEALRWTRQNIAAFGGKPGSGATAVLTLNPQATQPSSTFVSDHRCARRQSRPSGQPL